MHPYWINIHKKQSILLKLLRSILWVFGIPVILCLQELKLVFDAITRVWRGEFERLCRLRRSLKNKDNRWEIWFDMTSKCSDEQPRHWLGSCRLKGYSTPKCGSAPQNSIKNSQNSPSAISGSTVTFKYVFHVCFPFDLNENSASVWRSWHRTACTVCVQRIFSKMQLCWQRRRIVE